MSRLARMWLWLRRRLNPWLCPQCGVPMSKLYVCDLPADLQRAHRAAGTGWAIDNSAWICRHCPDDGICVMID